MRTVPSRPPLVRMLILLAAFAAGPMVGIVISTPLGTQDAFASIVSPWAYGFAFLGGLLFWFGRGALPLIRHAWGSGVSRDASGVQEVPPGYLSFVVLSVGFGGLAGFVVGLFTDATIAAAVGVHVLAGLFYGSGLWLLAHHGWLGFPEPE